MASSSLMALALVMSAKTDKASKEIDMFKNKTLNKIANLSRKAEDYIKSGFIDAETGKQILKPVTESLKKAIDFSTGMSKAAKELNINLSGDHFEKFKQGAKEAALAMNASTEETTALYSHLIAGGAAESELKKLAIRSDELSKALDVSMVHIPVILTPYSGDVDPSVDFGLFKRTFV